MKKNIPADPFTAPIPKGVRVEDTKMLTPGARETYTNGTNHVGKRHTTSHKPYGKLGAKGMNG